MKKLVVLIALTCGINGTACFAYPVLTEQDRRSIAATNLTEGQKQLAEHFVSYAKAEGQRAGIDPALAFDQSPTGVDDREYRRNRLRELREKREAQRVQIERLQSRESLSESLPRDEALLLVAKQIGVSPEKTQKLLAKYEPAAYEIVSVSAEENEPTVETDKLFGEKAPAVSPKEAERIRKAQEAEKKKAAEQARQDAKRREKEAKDEEKKRLRDKKAEEKQLEKQQKAAEKEAQQKAKKEYSPFYNLPDSEKPPADSKPPESVSTLERVAPEDVSMAAILDSKKQVPALFPEDYVYTPKVLSEEGE